MKYAVRIAGDVHHVLLVSEASFSGICKDVIAAGNDTCIVVADELLDSEPVTILNAITFKDAKY